MSGCPDCAAIWDAYDRANHRLAAAETDRDHWRSIADRATEELHKVSVQLAAVNAALSRVHLDRGEEDEGSE